MCVCGCVAVCVCVCVSVAVCVCVCVCVGCGGGCVSAFCNPLPTSQRETCRLVSPSIPPFTHTLHTDPRVVALARQTSFRGLGGASFGVTHTHTHTHLCPAAAIFSSAETRRAGSTTREGEAAGDVPGAGCCCCCCCCRCAGALLLLLLLRHCRRRGRCPGPWRGGRAARLLLLLLPLLASPCRSQEACGEMIGCRWAPWRWRGRGHGRCCAVPWALQSSGGGRLRGPLPATGRHLQVVHKDACITAWAMKLQGHSAARTPELAGATLVRLFLRSHFVAAEI